MKRRRKLQTFLSKQKTYTACLTQLKSLLSNNKTLPESQVVLLVKSITVIQQWYHSNVVKKLNEAINNWNGLLGNVFSELCVDLSYTYKSYFDAFYKVYPVLTNLMFVDKEARNSLLGVCITTQILIHSIKLYIYILILIFSIKFLI